ncbi:hybrid sensor histidine kinase/response regulator [Butyrivibrio sp. INlla16]|uniref:hybrid sensor histidine kinase/response regulator n=1 Tax=Butyrivibrio sp. INlla16 TaxID=1520807 RepID=UPI00087FC8BF|nr:response regulator [Butyrivibrio sp. INlla16]SDB61505.1 Signal transduction histidine kinase [Butyrivibrio sp. INlla16]
MSDNKEKAQDKKIRCKEWFFDYVIKQNRTVAAIFSAKDFKVEFLTDNAEEILGVDRELIYKDIRNLIDLGVRVEEEIPPSDDTIKKVPMGQTIEAEVLEAHNQKTGETKYFRGSINHTDMDGGDNFLLIWVDITEEIQRKRQMEDMIEVANAANEAKTSFLANMSHDFRTPMNAITNFNLLIAKNSDNPQKVRDYTHKIGLACQNLLSLLNDVLDMSKIESGKANIHNEEFALGLLLEEVNSVVAFQAKSKQLDYQIKSGSMPQDRFVGDKKRINEVLVNILGNAVKYTPTGGRIVFSVSEEKCTSGDYWDVRFSVRDNGIGMSKDFQEKLFDAFTREERKETSGIQGTGLGMAITKSLVQMMGGTISVDSEEGRGSTFVITLRLQSIRHEADDFWEKNKIRRLLVIDEDIDECHNIETVFEDTGVEVLICSSGYKAIKLIDAGDEEDKSIDVIVFCMQIRSLSCFEVASYLKEKPLKHKPVFILLTDDWEEIAAEAREAGIYDFLQRPFFLSTFRQLMENVVCRVGTEKEKQLEKPLKGIRLLAAEDNDINADILSELMNMEGAVIERASNGREAVEMFEKAEPGYYDMILMDIQMPFLNGYQATAAIRKLDKEDASQIPIIAMTANAYADDVQRALDAGMNAHVSKPIDMKVVEATILSLKTNMQST